MVSDRWRPGLWSVARRNTLCVDTRIPFRWARYRRWECMGLRLIVTVGHGGLDFFGDRCLDEGSVAVAAGVGDVDEVVSDLRGDRHNRLICGVVSCPEEMEQVPWDRGREQVAAWGEDKAEAAWAVRLPPVPVALVFVQIVDIGRRMWWASRAIRRAVPSVAVR